MGYSRRPSFVTRNSTISSSHGIYIVCFSHFLQSTYNWELHICYSDDWFVVNQIIINSESAIELQVNVIALERGLSIALDFTAIPKYTSIHTHTVTLSRHIEL